MLGSRWVAEFFGSRFDTPGVSLMLRALGSSRTREPCDRVLSLPCGFHMVAEPFGSVPLHEVWEVESVPHSGHLEARRGLVQSRTIPAPEGRPV